MVSVRRVPAKSLLSPTQIGGDFAVNPYRGCPHKCIYCYAACINHTGEQREEAWGDYLDVKEQKSAINLAKIFRKRILFSSMTDAYNPYEKKAELTRGIIKQLIPAEVQLCIITKSILVTRDIDLFKQFPYVKVIFSFSSLDDRFRRLAEPYAASPAQKIEALKLLQREGIATGVMCAPIFPEITQPVEILKAVAPYIRRITFDTLNLRAQNKAKVLKFVKEIRPDLAQLYDEIYLENKREYWKNLKKTVKTNCEKYSGLKYSIFF